MVWRFITYQDHFPCYVHATSFAGNFVVASQDSFAWRIASVVVVSSDIDNSCCPKRQKPLDVADTQQTYVLAQRFDFVFCSISSAERQIDRISAHVHSNRNNMDLRWLRNQIVLFFARNCQISFNFNYHVSFDPHRLTCCGRTTSIYCFYFHHRSRAAKAEVQTKMFQIEFEMVRKRSSNNRPYTYRW